MASSRVKKFVIGLIPLDVGSERILGKLVVISVVAEGSGALRKVAEIGFVLLLEQRILGPRSGPQPV